MSSKPLEVKSYRQRQELREGAGQVIAAGIGLKVADLTVGPIDVYSCRQTPALCCALFILNHNFCLSKILVLFVSLELTLGLSFVFLPLLFYACTYSCHHHHGLSSLYIHIPLKRSPGVFLFKFRQV